MRQRTDSGMPCELLIFGVAHDQAIVSVPQHEGFRDRLDGIAKADVGGLGTLDQPHLLGDVDRDADQMRLARFAVDQLGAGAQPYPAPVGMAHAEHPVDGRFAGGIEELGQRHQVAVVGMDQPADLAEAEERVARLQPDDLEHRA